SVRSAARSPPGSPRRRDSPPAHRPRGGNGRRPRRKRSLPAPRAPPERRARARQTPRWRGCNRAWSPFGTYPRMGHAQTGTPGTCGSDAGAMRRVRIGCSGWSYGDWRGRLYPDGLPQRRWLQRYAEVFDTVEVNATFYRLPKRATVEGWVEQVPGDFRFAVKASRYLTHMKRLHEIGDAVARF